MKELPKLLCPKCKAWLLSGWLVGEIICRRCGWTVKKFSIDMEAIKRYFEDRIDA